MLINHRMLVDFPFRGFFSFTPKLLRQRHNNDQDGVFIPNAMIQLFYQPHSLDLGITLKHQKKHRS